MASVITSAMHYEYNALRRLCFAVPLQKLRHSHAASHWLSQLAETASDLSHVLLQYPAVRYEPLDGCYALLQGLGTWDDYLLEDLMQLDEPGLLFAGILMSLAPRATTALESFERAVGASPSKGVSWWAERVRNARSYDAPKTLADESLRNLRVLFERCERACVTLPLTMAQGEFATLQVAMREAYRRGGANAAWAAFAANKASAQEPNRYT